MELVIPSIHIYLHPQNLSKCLSESSKTFEHLLLTALKLDNVNFLTITFPMLKGDNIKWCKNDITKLINCKVFTLNELKLKLQLEIRMN